jgi:serine/threonine protein kinase
MPHPVQPSPCDAARIERFLSDSLEHAEQVAFEKHLESCAACRETLDSSAGSDDAWREARNCLSSFAGGDALTSDSPAELNDALDHGIEGVLKLLGPTDDPDMLGRLAGYEIVGAIGCGGMGVVLKGFDPRLNRYAAIKLLAPHLAASASARRRFAREAKAAAAVVHENVVAIHGVAEFQGLPYLVMPYVKGESLQKRLDRGGPMSVGEVLRISRQIAAGLAAAHTQGLIHRDIKPANILLEEGVERLQITDFGLARTVDDASETRTGIIAGTPQYMSPEQARGDALDPRSDLFSVGSVMYAMCAGRPPFRAETPYGILRRITDDAPRPVREINPDVPDWLAAVIGKLHAKSAADRFASSEELAGVLEDCLSHVRQPTTSKLPASVTSLLKTAAAPVTPKGRARALAAAKQHSGWLAAAAVVTAALALWLTRPPKPTESTAYSESPRSTIPSPPATAPAWDEAADATTQLTTEVDSFKQRADQLWDP